jgi:hypothetical protein
VRITQLWLLRVDGVDGVGCAIVPVQCMGQRQWRGSLENTLLTSSFSGAAAFRGI